MSTRVVLGTLGDVDYMTHGGGLVLRITQDDGTETVEIEYVQEPTEDDCPTSVFGTEDEPSDLQWMVYQVTVGKDCLDQFDWIDLDEMASALGTKAAELRRKGRSEDVLMRARFIEDVALVYGWDNIDQEPLMLSREETETRMNGGPT